MLEISYGKNWEIIYLSYEYIMIENLGCECGRYLFTWSVFIWFSQSDNILWKSSSTESSTRSNNGFISGNPAFERSLSTINQYQKIAYWSFDLKVNFKYQIIYSYTSWSQFSIFDCILLSDTCVNEGNRCEIAVARSSGFLLLRPSGWHCRLLLGTLISDLWFKLSSFDVSNLLSICVFAYPVWSVSKVSRSS